jgi:hypothetical protein
LHQVGEKLGEMDLFKGSLHSCFSEHFFSCALLPMVSRPFASH